MIGLFAAYLVERFRPSVFVPAIVLHAALALWATGAEPTAARLASTAGLAALLLMQFRLWDDFEDRGRDRATHPERVLAVAPAAPFRRALAAIAIGNLIAMAARSAAAAAGLAVLDVAFLAAYRLRTGVSGPVWRFGILLAKYPAFVALVALAAGPPQTLRLSLATAVMYAAAILYEVLHDRHAGSGARPRTPRRSRQRTPPVDGHHHAESGAAPQTRRWGRQRAVPVDAGHTGSGARS